MPKLISNPTVIEAAGTPPKLIQEFIGRVNSDNQDISIARMTSPQGWSEPGQTPEFHEFTVVLNGTLRVETVKEVIYATEGQAIQTFPGEWVRYSTPYENGAEYIAVCLPAFSPDTVNRDV